MRRSILLAATAALAACSEPERNAHNAGPEANMTEPAGATSPEPAAEPGTPPPDEPGPGGQSPPSPPARSPAPSSPATYKALGQEPGWALTIAGGRIDYQGNYGEKRIKVAAPEPKPIPNGRRYVTPRLTIEVVNKRCNDAMSGFGFEDTVKIVADGETYEGCGGARRKDWDS
jgi:uncharacterized membrane protein